MKRKHFRTDYPYICQKKEVFCAPELYSFSAREYGLSLEGLEEYSHLEGTYGHQPAKRQSDDRLSKTHSSPAALIKNIISVGDRWPHLILNILTNNVCLEENTHPSNFMSSLA